MLVFVLYISTNVASEQLVATEGKPVTIRTYVRVVDPNVTNTTYEDNEDVSSVENTKEHVEKNFFDILTGYVITLFYSILGGLSVLGFK
ncbi:hypothetical protein B6U70_03270 [Euryarchaeota archaeon ex4484_162]|nr:MAG: hypothetical protein B6U70_03270 [Euryarchaeota archaeon ex4484_162]